MDHNQLTIKTFMAITAQRDAAIQEKNVALEERKRAFAERDMAMLQRDAAIAERDSAIRERDEAIAAMQTWECSVNNMLPDSAVEELADGAKDMHYQQQMRYAMTDTAFSPKEISTIDALNAAEVASETANSGEVGQPKEGEITKSFRSPRMSKRQAENMVKPITPASSNVCNIGHDLENEEDLERQPVTWKDNSGLNQINFDESSMPVPVCTCTGTPQPCYKWGSGGWQSACCTTTMSQYPLPQVSNKRTRVGGRKMSGSAFGKLLNRLAAEGHDLRAAPIDLKDHWAKHGTNRYSTLK